MKVIKDFSVKNKKVIVRCDFNVPLEQSGNILDDFRIQKSLPTLRYLIAEKARIIIITHLGEPEGNVVESLKLKVIKNALGNLLGIQVKKADDCIGIDVEKKVAELQDGEILLLENVRFHKEETENDSAFAKQLAGLGNLYVNDAFSDCHRAHASIMGIPSFLPSGAGLLLQTEVENLHKILQNPKHPLVVLVGGIKVGTKAKFIENISQSADTVIVSGLIKKELSSPSLRAAAWQSSNKIIGPAENLDALDIDEKTIEIFREKILQAKTIVWNGPFGKFEEDQYAHGTREIANAIIKSGAYSVVGGGETIEFLQKEGILDKFSHVSTGGGAMLEFLSGQELPGLKALDYET